MSAPIHADHPQAGFYKLRYKGGAWQPVAIWVHPERGLVARVGGEMRPPNDIWTYCAKNPVDKAAAKFAFEHGRWPDDPEPGTAQENLPADPFERLKLTIEERQERAAELLEKHPLIKSQETCNLFRNLQASILSDIKEADGLHEVEKRPILDAGKVVDDKFRFRASAKVLCERLRSRYETFMKTEEDRLKKEAAAKFQAEQERIRKERERIEAEAKKQMADDPIAALTTDPVEMPELPLAPEPVKVQAGGGVGRKAGLKTVYLGEITDLKAVVEHFIGHSDLKELIDKLVARAVKTGGATTKIPGVTVKEDRRAA